MSIRDSLVVIRFLTQSWTSKNKLSFFFYFKWKHVLLWTWANELSNLIEVPVKTWAECFLFCSLTVSIRQCKVSFIYEPNFKSFGSFGCFASLFLQCVKFLWHSWVPTLGKCSFTQSNKTKLTLFFCLILRAEYDLQLFNLRSVITVHCQHLP